MRRALDEVRRISSELRPEMLEHLGLVSALTELTTTFGRVSGIRRRAPVRPVAAEARARHRARRLPHRAGEPDQRRPPRAGDASHDHARARPRQRRPPRRRRRPRLRRRAGGARRPAQHARARPARSRARWRSSTALDGGVEVRLEVPAAPAVAAGGGRLMPIPLVTRILIADDFAIVRSGLQEGARRQARPRGRRRGRRRRARRSRRRSKRTSTWPSSTCRCRA